MVLCRSGGLGMSNMNLYDEVVVLEQKKTIAILLAECRLWRNQFLNEYASESKLHKDEYKYLDDYLFNLDELPDDCLSFYDLISRLRNEFKVGRIIAKYSYAEILEKMGDNL